MAEAASLLRYPSDMAVEEKTDYFSITCYRYENSQASAGIVTNFTGDNEGIFNFENKLYDTGSKTIIGDSILLPMPSNIQDSNTVSWGESKMNNLTAAGIGMGDALMNIDFTNLDGDDLGKKLTKIGGKLDIGDIQSLVKTQLSAEAVNVLGGNVTLDQILARSNGQIVNQNNRLLFNGVTLREFNFSFKLTPRNEKDMDNIKKIIRKLKMHMNASNNTSEDGRGRNMFIKTPGYFDLQYRKGQRKHPFLPSFKECALKNMAVNYTGENVYATYHDGTPISMNMDLTFQELVPIYAEDYTDSLEGVGY
jgi:hypothetical protein